MKTLFLILFFTIIVLASKAQIANDTLNINSDSSTVRLVFIQDRVQVTAIHLDGRIKGFVDYDPQAWLNKVWRVATEGGRRDLKELAGHRGLQIPRDPETPVSL